MTSNTVFRRAILIAFLIHLVLIVVVQIVMGYYPLNQQKKEVLRVSLTMTTETKTEETKKKAAPIIKSAPKVPKKKVVPPKPKKVVQKEVPIPEIPKERVEETESVVSREILLADFQPLTDLETDIESFPANEVTDWPDENTEEIDSIRDQGAVVDAKPNYRWNKPPKYPLLAKRKGLEGVVILLVEVDPEGNCIDAEIFETSGHKILDKAALKSVTTWKFYPATKNGVPVPSTVKVPVRFELRSSVG